MPTIESIIIYYCKWIFLVYFQTVWINFWHSYPPRPSYCVKETALVPIFVQPQCKTSLTGTGTLTRLALLFSFLYFGVWVGMLKGCTVRCTNRLIKSIHCWGTSVLLSKSSGSVLFCLLVYAIWTLSPDGKLPIFFTCSTTAGRAPWGEWDES